ncbi:MAG: GntR family transcriptional regulator [Desulfarculaceae bacterium]|nr:GntR family transcriptional regulator [Desulfarculaceae bacterium]MCF8071567.1 GntR family transcriptional regulator [Desulfarculaceae bacterium]MCF8102382.1 GntR family transcriptional regulator [Desulfarculaceae bacterium]MCF8114846.1 GntR family transcriptional regulator [Desulfarculaceae bacterium]
MKAIQDQLYKTLRKEIILGKLMPGERITETELAKRFSCSRSPVREALSRLHTEGFVEVLPRRGAVVSKTSAQEVHDYYALLKVLESQAVSWAAPKLTPEEIDKLEQTNEAMRQIKVDSQTGIEDWVRLNLEFHRLFRRHCGNMKMDWLVGEVRSRITRFLYTSLMVPAFDEYVQDHDLIIKQLRAKDHAAAADTMLRHVERAQAVLDRFLVREDHTGRLQAGRRE